MIPATQASGATGTDRLIGARALPEIQPPVSPRASQTALIATIDRIAPRLAPVDQGQIASLRDEIAASGPGAGAAPAPDDDSIFGKILDALNPLDEIKELWDKIRHALESAPPAAPLGIDKLLGADAAAITAKSPSLTADLKTLEAEGWKIQYGPAGGGTFCDKEKKVITIDANEKGNATALVQSLSHEAGHARYSYTPDYTSSKTYLEGTLGDEGQATLSNIRAQREILAAGGPDIGIAGNVANQKAYNAAYDRYVKTGDAATARHEIGQIYGKGEHTSTTGQSYEDYYLDWFHATFPGRP